MACNLAHVGKLPGNYKWSVDCQPTWTIWPAAGSEDPELGILMRPVRLNSYLTKSTAFGGLRPRIAELQKIAGGARPAAAS